MASFDEYVQKIADTNLRRDILKILFYYQSQLTAKDIRRLLLDYGYTVKQKTLYPNLKLLQTRRFIKEPSIMPLSGKRGRPPRAYSLQEDFLIAYRTQTKILPALTTSANIVDRRPPASREAKNLRTHTEKLS